MTTSSSRIIAPPSSSQWQAVQYLRAQAPAYDDSSMQLIVRYYWITACAVGVDPTLALAQCLHETTALDLQLGRWRALGSFWAQRPRRNPAGIGVTGQTSATPLAGSWAYNPARGRWEEGVSFPSWDEAVKAQVGRLLAYALRPGHEGAAQATLIAAALRYRSLPKQLRGSAPLLRQLGASHNPTGQGWAMPGDDYGQKIAALATKIQQVQR